MTKNKSIKTGTTFILLRSDGEVLMQQRDDGRGKMIPYPNKWCFPGGSLEKGETYIENVLREVYEEYELVVNKNKCRYILKYDHDDVSNDNVFLCLLDNNQKPILKEGRDMKWLTIDKIKDEELAWEQYKILDEVKTFINKLL